MIKGKHILVTRPAHQSQNLCDAIEEAGGTAFKFPTIEITELDDHQALLNTLNALSRYHMAIFASVNAVHRTLRYWPAAPPKILIGAIGVATASAIREYGLHVDIVPTHDFTSDAFLQLREVQNVEGQRIIIFSGEGGRALLENTLKQRGADVIKMPTYQRSCPQTKPPVFDWKTQGIDIIISTSQEGLENLLTLADKGAREWLLKTPILIVSQRMYDKAVELGFRDIVLSENASDAAIMAVLLKDEL